MSIPVDLRIAFLRERIEAATPPAQAWSWTWGTVNGALAAGQLAAIPFVKSEADRTLFAAGAIISGLGVIQVAALPLVPAAVPPAGGGCDELARLEASMTRAARNAAFGSGTMAQIGNVAINAAFGISAGAIGHSWQTGLLTFAFGWAIGEAQILTVPKGIIRDLERYRGGDLDRGGVRDDRARFTPRVAVALTGRTASLSIGVTF